MRPEFRARSLRAFTLLEVLIAVSLVLGLGALVAPSLLNALDEQTFDTAADVTVDLFLLARAEAQGSGKSVEVVYHEATRTIESRWFRPDLADDTASDDADDAFVGMPSDLRSNDE